MSQGRYHCLHDPHAFSRGHRAAYLGPIFGHNKLTRNGLATLNRIWFSSSPAFSLIQANRQNQRATFG